MTKANYTEFQKEIKRLKAIQWQGYGKTLREIGISYLGSVAQSAKLMHSYLHHINTYCVYLASADLSGYNVCPNSTMCKDNCLMGSGQNKLSRMSGKNTIDKARITKTRLFFANREVFMHLMVHEINLHKKRAENMGHEFSIRLNATSDINPQLFHVANIDGSKTNIFEMYKDTPIYDYTKVPNRLEVAKQFSNYDITWSLDGSKENEIIAKQYLSNGGKVAVVFGTKTFPKTFMGYPVIDGDAYDARYKDGNVIVGLMFKKTAENYKNGKFQLPNTRFIITEEDERCEW